MYKTFFKVFALCVLVLSACDLQPKIASIPDSIGMFIEDRYPALLADPDTQPEIYNSAVTDYGVYASPELYGSAKVDDYVLYASVDDYVLVPEKEKRIENKTEQYDDYLVVPMYVSDEKKPNDMIIVAKGDTVYSLARKNGMTVSEFAEINDLQEPYTLSVGQKLTTRKAVVKEHNVIAKEQAPVKPASKRIELQEITVQKGDTLYSLSRKYEIPVNDLAVMNKISSPFDLSVGQKIKVPKMDNVKTASVSEIKTGTKKVTVAKITPAKNTTTGTVQVAQKQKISSNPQKQLPKVAARSASKFSWPVRGKILSSYGAKSNGLFNDGINISAPLGSAVKAAENGVVAYAGNEVKGMGNLIIIQHSDGWMTIYAHLDSMSVKRGTRVGVGTQIGRVGKTGKVDQPQLHFEIRKGTKAYNPTQYLKK